MAPVENGLTSLSPYGLPVLSKSITSILKPLPFEKSRSEEKNSDSNEISLPGLKIPVFKNSSILQIINSNNSKIRADDRIGQVGKRNNVNKSENGSSLAEIEPESESVAVNDDMEVDDSVGPKYYLEIESFVPRNLQQQVTTLIIKGFPSVKKTAIEKILGLITSSHIQWSIINFEIIERRLLFIRFESILNLHALMVKLNKLEEHLENLKIFVDPKVEEYISKLSPNETIEGTSLEDEQLILKINRIIKSPKNQEKSSTKGSGTEDLDAVMSYFNTYKVEDAELVDVPNDMKSGIVKDIIKFRSKVLKIEKERRKKEIEQERQKAKSKLKKLFLEISSNEKAGDIEMDVDAEDDENSIDDEYSTLNDAEYDELMQNKLQKDKDTEYEKELKAMKDLEKYKKTVLEQKLASLRDYENDLVENKLKYIDDFKSFNDYDLQQYGSITSKLYYTNHSEYLRNRTKERAKEEKLDLLDEAEEQKEREEERKTSVVPKTTIIPVGVMPTTSESASPKNGFAQGKDSAVSGTSLSISSLPASTQSSIKDKISNLIEEYLGLKEDSLIDFVFDHLLENNLSKRESLTEELAETLDDDAQVVVDDLWKFINEVSSN
ncbi:U1 small nuclear ribonucleoprotein component Snu71p [[Candida] railenensis]|uniref:U1 small nuclear ribonucleoprotein component SNU71 n=1 Tax=[Candida] railenensis TaxID=45579 RepID=A0A9P0QM56_9ASCO|nr:U1 small nuclear ribonucleoprotein component Snu71p [[Candida] railenensis]